jgi:hypothetical protein
MNIQSPPIQRNIFKHKTTHAYLQMSHTLQFDFEAQLEGNVLKDDFKPILNEESIYGLL